MRGESISRYFVDEFGIGRRRAERPDEARAINKIERKRNRRTYQPPWSPTPPDTGRQIEQPRKQIRAGHAQQKVDGRSEYKSEHFACAFKNRIGNGFNRQNGIERHDRDEHLSSDGDNRVRAFARFGEQAYEKARQRQAQRHKHGAGYRDHDRSGSGAGNNAVGLAGADVLRNEYGQRVTCGEQNTDTESIDFDSRAVPRDDGISVRVDEVLDKKLPYRDRRLLNYGRNAYVHNLFKRAAVKFFIRFLFKKEGDYHPYANGDIDERIAFRRGRQRFFRLFVSARSAARLVKNTGKNDHRTYARNALRDNGRKAETPRAHTANGDEQNIHDYVENGGKNQEIQRNTRVPEGLKRGHARVVKERENHSENVKFEVSRRFGHNRFGRREEAQKRLGREPARHGKPRRYNKEGYKRRGHRAL